MTVIPLDTDALKERGLARRVDSLLAALGQGFNAYLERRARIDAIRHLNAKSDAELAAMGLTRERIPHFVFRDLMAF